MSRGHTLVAVCALVLSAGDAMAQRANASGVNAIGREAADAPRRLEGGVFIGLDRFGDDIELGNAWAPEQIPGTALLLGARAGLVFLPDLAPGAEVDPSLGVELEARWPWRRPASWPPTGATATRRRCSGGAPT